MSAGHDRPQANGGNAALLRDEVLSHFSIADFPALTEWGRRGRLTRPLAGLRILVAFPTWPNTLALYLTLMESGADLVFTPGPVVPHDPATVGRLPPWGVAVTDDPTGVDADIVLDCAGALAHIDSRLGYAELTRSGVAAYRSCPLPVFLVDAGRIKLIENALGTGDGFVRGLAHHGYSELADRRIVVFGGGKVGGGVALRCSAAGAAVTIIDRHSDVRTGGANQFVALNDTAAVRQAVLSAWCIVTATGEAGAVAPFAAELVASDAVLANLGVDDEYGPQVPVERVLNGKKPLNFCLSEPTRLRYIDPTFALATAGAIELANRTLTPGINVPDPHLEEQIMAPVRAQGAIASELAAARL